MRGTVEVLAIVDNGKEEVLYREDNLVVNEAGRTLVDMLTTPSSTLGIAPRIMDTSNWVIQAISFGKDPSAFNTNAHAGRTRRNLIKWSTPSSLTSKIASQTVANMSGDGYITSRPTVSPPPGFENVPSSIAHVVEFSDERITFNDSIAQWLYFDNGAGVSHSDYPNMSPSGGQDLWVCYSSYIKAGTLDNPWWKPSNIDFYTTLFQIRANGEGYQSWGDGGIGKSRNSIDPGWDFNPTKTLGTVSSLAMGFQNDMRYTSEGAAAAGKDPSAAGYGLNQWDAGGGMTPVGNDWYRIWASILTPVSGVSSIGCIIYPTGQEGVDPTGETSGGIYTYGHQLEVGRWPTTLQFNNGVSTLSNWDWSGSVLNKDSSPGSYDDSGTVRVSGTFNGGIVVSSYEPSNWLDKYPDPLDTQISLQTQSPFGNSVSGDWSQRRLLRCNIDEAYTSEMGSVLSAMDWGQNLNMIPFRNQINGDTYGRVFFDLYTSSQYYQHGQQQKDWFAEKGVTFADGTSTSAVGQIGPQGYYLGCWPESSSMGGTRWAMVSSLESSIAYGEDGQGAMVQAGSDPLVGIFNSGFNEASSMDVFGFVGKVYDPINGRVGLGVEGVSLSGHGLIVSSTSKDTGNFADNGKVIYETNIFSGDAGMANLFGGIYNIGLWTIDLKESLKNTEPPFVFDALDNPIKYRLFSSKKFVDNLVGIHDGPLDGDTPPTYPAGIFNHPSLKIRWTLDFRSTGNA